VGAVRIDGPDEGDDAGSRDALPGEALPGEARARDTAQRHDGEPGDVSSHDGSSHDVAPGQARSGDDSPRDHTSQGDAIFRVGADKPGDAGETVDAGPTASDRRRAVIRYEAGDGERAGGGHAASDHRRPGDHDEAGRAGAEIRVERALGYRAEVEAVYRAYAIDQGCARVERIERETVTPAMRRIEAEDPERHLAGLEHRLKERYRIEEKVNHDIEKRGVSPADAFAAMKDAIRYTYCYPDDGYVDGVLADSDRLKGAGFEFVNSRNWWSHDEYKGLNSWWRVPETSQIFEVQFHTQASLDAKEETHAAYERLRTLPPDHTEVRDLRAYQREVTAKLPTPPGAPDILLS
jgi:hypothetical protein